MRISHLIVKKVAMFMMFCNIFYKLPSFVLCSVTNFLATEESHQISSSSFLNLVAFA